VRRGSNCFFRFVLFCLFCFSFMYGNRWEVRKLIQVYIWRVLRFIDGNNADTLCPPPPPPPLPHSSPTHEIILYLFSINYSVNLVALPAAGPPRAIPQVLAHEYVKSLAAAFAALSGLNKASWGNLK
jgi:hypothetical protein